MPFDPFLFLHRSLKGCTAPVHQRYIFIHCSPVCNISITTDTKFLLLSQQNPCCTPPWHTQAKDNTWKPTTKEVANQTDCLFKIGIKAPILKNFSSWCLLIDAFPFLLTLNIQHGLAAGLISATALLIWTMLAVVLTDIYWWSEESHSKEQALVNSRKRVDMIPKALPCFSDLGEKPLIYSMELPYVCSCKGALWSSAVQPVTQCLFVCLWRGLAAVLPLKINPLFLKLDSEPWNKSCRVNSPCC